MSLHTGLAQTAVPRRDGAEDCQRSSRILEGILRAECHGLLQDFARTVDGLLDNGALLNSEHRRVRTELDTLLPGFQKQLRLVQSQFSGMEGQIPGSASRPNFAPRLSNVAKINGGANKRKADDGRAATQPPTSEPRGEKRMKTASQPSQFRAMSAQPVAWLRERFLARVEQAQEPAIKSEPSP